MRIEERIEIERGRDEVFDFIADHGNDPRWCRKVKAVEPVDDGAWKIWHKPIPLRPAALLEATHLRTDRPAYLAIREEDHASVFNVEYRLDETATGTLLIQVSEFKWKKLPRQLQRVLALGVRRDVAGQLRELKRCLEHA
jgi:Polyketide cyclase / dehydrase and lipid transport